MLSVEDALELIASRLKDEPGSPLVNDWHLSFVQNVAGHVAAGKPLSTEQSKIVLKLARKFSGMLVEGGFVSQMALDSLLADPTHRRPPYLSADIRKEVRFLGGNLLGFRFKFSEIILRDIRALAYTKGGQQGSPGAALPVFNREHRIWMVPVVTRTLAAIRALIATHRFGMDVTVRDYLALVQCSRNKSSTAAFDDQSNTILLNVCDNEILACWTRHVAGGRWV